MIDTILLDLDGSLLHFTQEAFISKYFKEISKVFMKLGLDPEAAVKAVWAGTKAMIANDGTKLNSRRFWDRFAETMQLMDDQVGIVERACDLFYSNEFDIVKSIVTPNDISKRLLRSLSERGYTIVLATNPLFPECAVTTRLGWAGLSPNDFSLITHYANSTFCKPNLGYYQEVLSKIGKAPENCLMAGNSPSEDMCAGALGMEVYLLTDCLENETGLDIAQFHNGTLAEFEAYLRRY